MDFILTFSHNHNRKTDSKPIIHKLRKRIRATPCLFYFLFVDFKLGKIDFRLILKYNFNTSWFVEINLKCTGDSGYKSTVNMVE